MANLTISSAASLTGATTASGDLFPCLDVSAASGSQGSKITRDELGDAMTRTAAMIAALAAKLDKAGGTMTGGLTVDRSGLATTPVAALTAQNSTAAALGAQQVSPSSSLVGQGWNNSSNASHPVEWAAHTLPVQGNPVTSQLLLRHRVNNGSWVTALQLSSPNDSSGQVMTLSSPYGSCALRIGGAGDTRMSSLASTGFGSFQIDQGGGNVVILTAAATGLLQLGVNHATTPTAQTLKAHNVTTGVGAELKLCGGTGSVGKGAVIVGDATDMPAGFHGYSCPQASIYDLAASFVDNIGAPVNDHSTFNGYTLGQVVHALQQKGILA